MRTNSNMITIFKNFYTTLTEKYEDPHQVLMAYNCGEAGAKKLWKQGKTTSEYSREIMIRAEELREEGK